MDVKERIIQLRDERGWSNYRLASEANMSEGSLNNLFRLKYQPTIPTLESLCDAFGISLSQFFAGSEEAVVLSDEQKELHKAWDRLGKEQRIALLEFLKKI